MTDVLVRLRQTARRREAAIALAWCVPVAVTLIAVAARLCGTKATIVVASIAIGLTLAVVLRAIRRLDDRQLARRLDAKVPALDDSATLLFHDVGSMSSLQRLQRARLDARMARRDVDLRAPWPRRNLVLACIAALTVAAVATLWHAASPRVVDDAKQNASTVQNMSTPALKNTVLDIIPPNYTQLPPRTQTTLDAKMPQGSMLHWRLRFDRAPSAAVLQFHDGSRLALQRDGDDWIAERALTESALYRVIPEGAAANAVDRLHRLDVVADAAPQIRVLQPEKSLTLRADGQKTWDFALEASDDYGIAGAQIALTHAQGTGENVTFKDQTIALDGEPIDPADGARQLRYRHTLDLGTLGLAEGDDLVVRVAVSDAAEPKPHTTRSASFVLRWPVTASADSAGLEGVVQHTMPAYFRSQRQIIIDSDALLAEKSTLVAGKYLARSDAIGVDQKILRLRYGQFLGEESETHAEDAAELSPKMHAADKPTQVDALAAAHAAQERVLRSTPPPKFGEEGNTVAEYGHVHDIAEAATLLDKDTRTTLKAALDEMWQAELHLRQGAPDLALPYEHRALELIKQVQQSTRIYLARTGLELPKPDEARRLTGERKALGDRLGSLAPARVDVGLLPLWNALSTGEKPDWTQAQTWLRAHQAQLPDALGVIAALDRVERDPHCDDCRTQLESLLWSALPTPATAAALRVAPNASGRAYLDALGAGAPKPQGDAR